MPDLKTDVPLSFLTWLAGLEAAREEDYQVYREYYDGDHDTQLTERMRKYLQIKSGVEFRTNYCPIVVDSLADRLSVTGFGCEGQEEVFAEWWQQNRMDGVQGVLHTAALRDGDAYLMVEWDAEHGRPRFVFEPAYDGSDGVKVIYDEASNTPRLASKRWRITRSEGAGYLRRMNVYYPDRVEKYLSNQLEFEGAWQPYEEPGEPAKAPWLARDGSPLGLPLVHFKNKDQGYNYGCSELKDIVPLQNALNKAIIDMVAAADTTGFRIYWMLGDDPSGISMAPGTWIYSTRPPGGESGAAVGYFPGENLQNLIDIKDAFAIEVARVSRTPVSYFQVSGQRPAEGTLKQEESGLVGKAKNRQVSIGNAWEDAIRLARRIWNTYGPGPELAEDAQITCLWKDAETRNDKALLEGLQIKSQLGVPREQLWREMGYDAETIAEMQDMVEAERERESNLGDRLMEAFERAGREEEPALRRAQAAGFDRLSPRNRAAEGAEEAEASSA